MNVTFIFLHTLTERRVQTMS